MRIVARSLDRMRTAVLTLLRIRTRGCAMVAFDQAGKVVLVRLTYGPSVWSLPGGGVHRNERFRDAALREANEEAGVVAPDDAEVRLLGLYLRRQGHWLDDVAVYVADGCVVHPRRTWEVAKVAVFDPRELPKDVSPATKRRIQEAIGDCPVTGDW